MRRHAVPHVLVLVMVACTDAAASAAREPRRARADVAALAPAVADRKGPAQAPAPGAPSPEAAADRVQLTIDTTEAQEVLALVALHRGGRAIDEARWQRLFATEPYQLLKKREAEMARVTGRSGLAFTDEDFRQFVLSDELADCAPDLARRLAGWGDDDLRRAAERPLRYLPLEAVLRARVLVLIKPEDNSFVWGPPGDRAIFLALKPDQSPAEVENIVAHELHHIGVESVGSRYGAAIASLPPGARIAAGWIGAFSEGMAVLAAAGGPDVDPQAASEPADQARWKRDLARFDTDLRALDAFFADVIGGKLATPELAATAGLQFFGEQGPWYTVGYRMAVMVEKRFGRQVLLEAVVDPRRLLARYNEAAREENRHREHPLPLWSEHVLAEVGAHRP